MAGPVVPFDPRLTPRARAGLLATAVALGAVIVAAVGIGIVSIASPRPVPIAGASPPATDVLAASPAPSGGSAPGSDVPVALSGRPPGVGWIAAVDALGALTLTAPDGRATALGDRGATTVGFPAFSPDGRRLAAIVGEDGATTVDVFDLDRETGTASRPKAIYRSAVQHAFYLSWTPGSRDVSFLTNDVDVVALRIAAADRTSPLDETDRGSLIRRGAPLYFDWIDDEDALLHVGVGDGAFLGLARRDGRDDGGTLQDPGDFRVPQVSADGRFVAWVRTGAAGSEVVVAARDGASEQTLPVFGPAAVVFSPTDDRVAAIGADAPGQADLAFPIGPLRTIDATDGTTRVLLDGAVVASFWAPDGRTVAALRLQVPSGTTALTPGRLAATAPSPVPSEVHLLFVDVASGAIRSDRVVQPAGRLVSEILPYFDQYELSHRLWAPDGSSFLLPIVNDAGAAEVVALPPDGGEPGFSIAAPAAFWSP